MIMICLFVVFCVLLFLVQVFVVEIGDDGFYKVFWMWDIFKDFLEDFVEVMVEGKCFMVIVEQWGCIYCK